MASPFDTLPADAAPPATEAARNYLRDLMLDKAAHQGTDETTAAADIDAWLTRHPSRPEVSEHIDRLKAEGYTGRRYRGRGPRVPELDDGFYELPDGRLVKVIHAIHGSGYQYGKVLVPDNVGTSAPNWVKETGILAEVAASGKRVDTDESRSRELGKLYGVCMVCGTELTDESSIEMGIGPVCRAKRGW